MIYALKRPTVAGAITLVVASSWSNSIALAGCTATALSASAGIFGPPSINATESSTAQALELIRQRRMQVAEACPTGFTRSGGVCQPLPAAASSAAAPAAAAPSALPSPSAGSPPSPSASVPGASAVSRPKAASTPRVAAAAPAPSYGGSLKDSGFDPGPSRLVGTWVEGFADWERHDDVRPDIAGGQDRETYTTGLLSGMDATDVSRGFQIGLLSGYTYSQSKIAPFTSTRLDNEGDVRNDAVTFDQKQSVEGTSLGLYAAYFTPTGFSADFLYKLDMFDYTQSESVGSDGGCGSIRVFSTHGETTLTNNVVASNLYYRWDIGGGRWLEPTLGFRYVHTAVGGNGANLGLDDGDAFRIQGGVRLGHSWVTPQGYVVTTGLTGLLYSDVVVDGFAIPTFGVAPGIGEIDEGKLRVLGLAQAKIDLNNGATWYGQVEVRGGEDLIGVGGKVGVRMRW